MGLMFNLLLPLCVIESNDPSMREQEVGTGTVYEDDDKK